jgi:hypothetical protein
VFHALLASTNGVNRLDFGKIIDTSKKGRIMSGVLSVKAFWTTLLFVHLILALGLLGALTHQAVAVALPARQASGGGIIARYRSVRASGYATAVCTLWVLTFFVGAYIYTAYTIYIKIPLIAEHYFKTGAFFDFKEHVASLGLLLLPAYWYLWKNADNPEYDNARKGVTIVLASFCWFLFLVGHFLNNARGFGS